MATYEPNTTRRQALAGLAITAALGAMPVVALTNVQPDRTAWNAAIAAYEKADKDADVAHERWNRAAETYQAITGRTPWDKGPMDEAASRLSGFAQLNHTIDEWGDRVAEAAERVLEMPAPDSQALLWKLEYLFGSELDGGACSTSCWSAEFFAQTMTDIRRLLTVGRA
jgi:hypothetical protein